MIEVTPAEQAMWREMEEQQREWAEIWDEVEHIELEREIRRNRQDYEREREARNSVPGGKGTESKA